MDEFFQKVYERLTQHIVASIADVLLMAVLIYALIVFLKKNNSVRLVKYVIILLVAGVVLSAESLMLDLTGRLFSYTAVLLIIFVALLYPQDVRRGLFKLAASKESGEYYSTQYNLTDDELKKAIDDIVRATQNMSKKDVGALMIIAVGEAPKHILESGTALDAVLSCQLIECIFNTKAPLHDGAVFIRGNRILSAGCFLPLSQSITIDKELGTRHRAAIGITEVYNGFAIIVSEETGVISVAHEGLLSRYYDSAMLTEKLEQIYGLKAADKTKKKSRRTKAKS